MDTSSFFGYVIPKCVDDEKVMFSKLELDADELLGDDPFQSREPNEMLFKHYTGK